MTVDDQEDLEVIVETSAKNGHRFRDLIEAVILSELFAKR